MGMTQVMPRSRQPTLLRQPPKGEDASSSATTRLRGDIAPFLLHMRYRTAAILAITVSLSACTPPGIVAHGDAPDALPLEVSRLRLELVPIPCHPHGERSQLVGTLTGMDSTMLELRVGSTPSSLRIPYSVIERSYISRGPRPRGVAMASGAARAGVLGLVGGLIAAAFRPSGTSAGDEVRNRAIGSAMVGLVIGAVRPGERWRRVWLLAHSPVRPTEADPAPCPH